MCNVCCITKLINFFGYTLFARIDLISYSDLFLDSESADRETAFLVSPMSIDFFEAIEPWLFHGVIHRLWKGFTYSVVVNLLVVGLKDTKVSRYGRLFCVGSSIVNLIASFRLLAIDNKLSLVIEFDVHAINMSSISPFKKRQPLHDSIISLSNSFI